MDISKIGNTSSEPQPVEKAFGNRPIHERPVSSSDKKNSSNGDKKK